MGGRAADTLDGGRVVVGVGTGRPGCVLDDMINAEIVAPAAAEPAAIRASVDFDMTDDQCLVQCPRLLTMKGDGYGHRRLCLSLRGRTEVASLACVLIHGSRRARVLFQKSRWGSRRLGGIRSPGKRDEPTIVMSV